MKNYNAFVVFSVVGCIAYAIVAYILVADGALFTYYPVVGEFHMTPQPKSAGYSMYYYGWKLSAAVIGLIAALIIPRIWKARLWSGWTWIIPLIILAITVFFEKRWFL